MSMVTESFGDLCKVILAAFCSVFDNVRVRRGSVRCSLILLRFCCIVVVYNTVKYCFVMHSVARATVS